MIMQKYRTILRGENILMDVKGAKRRYGFFATRFIEAETPAEAESKSLALVRNDPELRQSVRNEDVDPPVIVLEELEALKQFDGSDIPGSGYTFYPEDAVESED